MIDFAPHIDEKYATFVAKLVPTRYKILGVRMPILHRIAKNLNDKERKELLDKIPQNLSCEEWLLIADVLAKICESKQVCIQNKVKVKTLRRSER